MTRVDSKLKSHRILPVLLLASTLLALTPSAAAQANPVEGFEDLTPPESPGTTDYYGPVISGTGAVISTTAQAKNGEQSIRLTGSTFNFGMSNSGEDFCGISWWVYFSAFPTSSPYWMGITDGANSGPFNPASTVAEWAAFSVSSTGVVQRQYDSDNAGAAAAAANFGLTLTLDTWYNFQIDCAPEDTSGTLLFYETTTDTVVQIGGQTFDDDLDLLTFAGDPTGTSAGSYTAYVDDVAFPFTLPTAGVIFCADPSLEAGEDGSTDDFGYEYVEDWSYEADLTDTSNFDLQDGFLANVPDGNSAYFAKGFSTGSPALAVRFRIEGGTDATSSVFRVAFTEGNSGTPSSTIAGNSNGGTDGSSFDDHVGIRFEEEGDQWRVTFRQNVAGAGYNTIGSSFVIPGHNPNSPHTYNFTADSRNLTVRLLDEEGGEIAARSIDAAFQDQLWEDQWFIATGTGILSASTALDDNTDAGDTDDSTCIFDLTGEAVVTGSQGSQPGSSIVPPPVDDGDSGGGSGIFNPANIDSTLFIGFLLVAGMIFTGARQGIVGTGLVGIFLLGIGLGFALGWIPLWLVLVLFVVSLAAVWFLPKPSGDGVS